MDHKVSIQSATWRCRGAGARSATADLRRARSADRPGRGVPRPYPHVGGGAPAAGAGETSAVPERAVVANAAAGVSPLAEAILGPAPVARGYFCATVGAVDE